MIILNPNLVTPSKMVYSREHHGRADKVVFDAASEKVPTQVIRSSGFGINGIDIVTGRPPPLREDAVRAMREAREMRAFHRAMGFSE